MTDPDAGRPKDQVKDQGKNQALAGLFAPDRPLLLIGGGKMGGALLDGWLARGLDPAALVIAEPNDDLRARFDQRGLVTVADAAALTQALIPVPALALFATKPQVIDAVLAAYAPKLADDCLVLSIAAGVTLARLATALPGQRRIVRAMPNTPAAVGAGVTALFAADAVTAAERNRCAALLAAVGAVVWLESEGQMDAVTGLSGSGPAYVFHLIECLTEAGVAEGLPLPLAETLARQTVYGAGKLAAESADSPAQLRINVTSPQGTTAAGLAQLMPALPGLIRQTVAAAAARSRELAAG